MPLTTVVADSSQRNRKVMYVTSSDQDIRFGRQPLSKRKLQIYSRWHRFLAILEIVSALVLLGMEIATTVTVPSAQDTTRSHRPLLITSAMCYALSLFLPATLSLMIAQRRRKALLTFLIIVCVLESGFSAGMVAVHIDFMTAPVEPGTLEASLLEAKFGLGISLCCLIMLATIGQTILCCRETCQRRCNRTQDTYTGVDMVEVEVHHSERKFTNIYSKTPYSEKYIRENDFPAFNLNKAQSIPLRETYSQSYVSKPIPSAPPMYQFSY